MNPLLSTLVKANPGTAGIVAALEANRQACFDSTAPAVDPAAAADSAASFTAREIRLNATAAVQEWCGTAASDLEDGEGFGDRLIALLIGIADANLDGEIGDDEADVAQSAMDEAYAYMHSRGVAAEDLDAMFNGDDAAASNDSADRVREFMLSVIPEGEGAMDEVDSYVFGAADEEPALDAAYRRVVAIRKGKKTFVHKRISGTVRLTGKQKMSIRKAGLRAHSAVARMRRAKSMKLSRNMGLGKR